jgi:predicted Zn-dependent protease
MRKLGPPETHFLKAAQGWLELGSPDDADEELRQLPQAIQARPEVLELRWQIYARQKRWDYALAVSRALIKSLPSRATGWVHQSFILHEMKRTAEARELLTPAAERFPKDSIIPYNLACYACQLGDFLEAHAWLQKAMEVGDKNDVKKRALTDEDLRPMWHEIEKL